MKSFILAAFAAISLASCAGNNEPHLYYGDEIVAKLKQHDAKIKATFQANLKKQQQLSKLR